MDRVEILGNLEAIISKVVDHVREDSVNLEFKRTPSNFYVRSLNSFYNVYEKETNQLRISDISDIDFVKAIIKNMDERNSTRVRELLEIEREYKKHINDMLFYVNSYKKSNDHIMKEVLEDRFNLSKYAAQRLKNKIKNG